MNSQVALQDTILLMFQFPYKFKKYISVQRLAAKLDA
jgi:hypothetical protein